jgi:hypothetical protein
MIFNLEVKKWTWNHLKVRRPPMYFLIKKGGNPVFGQLGGLDGREYRGCFFMDHIKRVLAFIIVRCFK